MRASIQPKKILGVAVVAALILLSVPTLGKAETQDGTTGGAAKETPAIEAAKKNATELGNSGRQLMKKGKFAAALLEYEASNRAYPSWQALAGMGRCLTGLKRYDEALDAWDAILSNYSDVLPDGTKKELLTDLDLLRKETGALMVTSASPGALIFVDGRWRGEHPLRAPVPTLTGRHWVRVYKEGFAIFEQEVDTPQGGMSTLDVTLTALSNAGRIQVDEIAGKKMEVVIDGVPVGLTPWAGPVSPGPHAVSLRPVTIKEKPDGNSCASNESPTIPDDAGDPTSHEMGTEPEVVNVTAGQTSSVQLKAERLGAVVRIVPEPPNAAVYIDGVFVGRGPYIGRSRPGKHVVKTKAEGYFETTSEINATAGDESTPRLPMKKDLNAPEWAVAGRVLLEIRTSVPLALALGGVVDEECAASSTCQRSLGAGANAVVRGGYEWPNGLGFGGTIGYFQMEQSHVGFDAKMNIDNLNVDGQANDSTFMQNFMGGVYGSYRIGSRFPIRFGVGAGVLYGRVDYSREGTFDGNAIGPLRQTGNFMWIYVEPEVRVGVRLSERWSVGVAISALVQIAPRVPAWTNAMQVNAHNDGTDQLGSFTTEDIASNIIFAMNQGLYLQYGF